MEDEKKINKDKTPVSHKIYFKLNIFFKYWLYLNAFAVLDLDLETHVTMKKLSLSPKPCLILE